MDHIIIGILGGFLIVGLIFLVVFILINRFWPLPIRTTDPSGSEVKKYYDKGKDCFKIRSGEVPPSFFNEEFVDMLKNRDKGTQIIVEDMICIGKRVNNEFISSPLLIHYFSQENQKKPQKEGERKVEIKMIKTGATLKKDNTIYHPDHFHYRIYDNAIFYHEEDNKTYYLRGLKHLKEKFKRKFDNEWEKGETLSKAFLKMEENENLLVEIDIKIIDGDRRSLYEKAKKEEIEKFKIDAGIINQKKKTQI